MFAVRHRSKWCRNFCHVTLVTCCCCLSHAAHAGTATGDVQPDTALESHTLEAGSGFFNSANFLAVPIPISNPTIGSGGALALGLLFKTDEKSTSSLLGAGGFYTSNGSFGGGAMADIAWGEDRYRAKASGRYASVSYDFFGIGTAAGDGGIHVSLTQSGYLFEGAFETRVAPEFFLGAQARYMRILTRFDLPDVAGGLLDNGDPLSRLEDKITTFGLTARYDSRNRDYSPSSGQLVEGTVELGLKDFVSRNGFVRTTAIYNRYDRIAKDLVLASHASLCMANGKVPIFDLCLFGARNDLRGYAVGRFQDKAMIATQAELRWHAFWRVGLVAFAGMGSVAHSVDKFSDVLASAGGGVRVLVSEDYGVNLGVDAAVTKDGQVACYVGEAF
jgi:hypothetical protein